MHVHNLESWRHEHHFLDDAATARNQRRVSLVVLLTAATMVVEIGAGWIYNSMALLADGWHMGSHAAALGITLFAYAYARRHAGNRRYTFGTGKVGVLGGFTSAVVLALVALLMVWESIERLLDPLAVRYEEAMVVALVGLVVNLASAKLLHHDHHPDPGRAQGHSHGHGHGGSHVHNHGQDHNMRAAYLHVLADALTSLLAIGALAAGMVWGWTWMDPAAGIVGAAVIAWWARGLLADTGRILLDGSVEEEEHRAVRERIEADADNRVVDLHLWRVGPGQTAAVVSLVTHYPQPPDHYRGLLLGKHGLTHVTVEVHAATSEPCIPIAEEERPPA